MINNQDVSISVNQVKYNEISQSYLNNLNNKNQYYNNELKTSDIKCKINDIKIKLNIY